MAEEISESSIKLSWHFPSETATPMLVSGNGLPDSHQQAVNGRHFQDQIDGFVLTFSRVSSRFKLASPTSKSLPDSAARISLQAPPTSPNGPPATAANHHQLIQADHQWQAVQLAPQQRKHLLKNLECGTWYAMKIWAFNKVGKGEPSELVTVSTRGKGESFFKNGLSYVHLYLILTTNLNQQPRWRQIDAPSWASTSPRPGSTWPPGTMEAVISKSSSSSTEPEARRSGFWCRTTF